MQFLCLLFLSIYKAFRELNRCDLSSLHELLLSKGRKTEGRKYYTQFELRARSTANLGTTIGDESSRLVTWNIKAE